MFEVLFKIWFMIAVLPFLIFLEGNTKLARFLKKRGVYSHWDVWHSFLVIAVVLLISLWMMGVR